MLSGIRISVNTNGRTLDKIWTYIHMYVFDTLGSGSNVDEYSGPRGCDGVTLGGGVIPKFWRDTIPSSGVKQFIRVQGDSSWTHSENEGTTFCRNVGNNSPNETIKSQSWRSESSIPVLTIPVLTTPVLTIRWLWSDSDRASSLICGNKMPTRCNRWYLLQVLLLTQHVSGTIMPIIRSSRVLYRWSLHVVFGALVFKLPVWCGAEGYVSGLRAAAAYRQLEKQSTKYHRQRPSV